jgi:carboxymethylenebutenolidase
MQMAYKGMIAESVRVHGHENELIDAYAARPLGGGPYPGVLLIHHMPGWDEWTREVVHKIAHHGFNTVSPDLHFRQGRAQRRRNRCVCVRWAVR